jgi:ATP-binding cassette subfamily B protein
MTDMSAWTALRSSVQRSDTRNARRVDWHTLRRVGRFARHRRSTIAAFLALATVSAALGVASPVIAGRAVNAIVEPS